MGTSQRMNIRVTLHKKRWHARTEFCRLVRYRLFLRSSTRQAHDQAIPPNFPDRPATVSTASIRPTRAQSRTDQRSIMDAKSVAQGVTLTPMTSRRSQPASPSRGSYIFEVGSLQRPQRRRPCRLHASSPLSHSDRHAPPKDYAKGVSFTPPPVSPASRRATPNNVPRAHSPRTRKPAQPQTAPKHATAAPRTTLSTPRMPPLATLPPAPRRPLQRAPAPTQRSSLPTSTRRPGEIRRRSGSWSRSAGRARLLAEPEVRGARRGGRRGTRRRRHPGSSAP